MIKIKLTHKAEKLTRGSKFSTGLDLKAKGFSLIINNKIIEPIWFDESNIKSVTLKPFERVLIKTGIQFETEEPYVVENKDLILVDTTIRNRSGLTLKTGVLCNLGVIDCEFRGDIGCSMINLSNEDYTINENDAVGQLCFSFAGIPVIDYVDNLSDSERGGNGFGSTEGTKNA